MLALIYMTIYTCSVRPANHMLLSYSNQYKETPSVEDCELCHGGFVITNIFVPEGEITELIITTHLGGREEEEMH